MNEIIELTKSTGIAFACLCALAFAVWRSLVFLSVQALGDQKANPPLKGFVREWLENQKRFHDAMESQGERQMALCERHNATLVTVNEILGKTTHDVSETSGHITDLVRFHTDATVSHSAAQAIHNVAQLKLVAMCACNGCREAMSSIDEPVKDIVIRKCDEIEEILKNTV